MGYQKLSEGISKEDAAKKISGVMPNRRKIEKINSETPPSIFIGSRNYPNVTVGVLSPPHITNPTLFDSPKKWREKNYSIKRIASLRGSMVNSYRQGNAKEVSSDLSDLREVAMAKKPTNVEADLGKNLEMTRAGRVKPTSNFSEAEFFQLGENPSVDKQIEKKFYDRDAPAETAIRELSQKGKDIYQIRQALTAGLLGQRDERRLVPTRWGITATDDMISSYIKQKLGKYKTIDSIKHFENHFLGNEFDIFLIPGEYEYELLELKRPGSTWNESQTTVVKKDYEPYEGRSDYASETAGAFYAARLALLEYMDQNKIKAKALVLRDVQPDYYAPLGVWVVREGMRKTLEDPTPVENYRQMREHLSRKYTINFPKIAQNSKLVSSKQTSINLFN